MPPGYVTTVTTFLSGVTCVFGLQDGDEFWLKHPDLCRLLGDRGPFAHRSHGLTEEDLARRDKNLVTTKRSMLYKGHAINPGELFLLTGGPDDAWLKASGHVHRAYT